MVRESPHQRRGRNNKHRGATIEREVARITGGKRIGNRGTSSADVETDTQAIEVKSTISPTPAWWLRAWEQAEQAAKETGKEPVIIRSNVDKGRRVYWEIRRLAAVEVS